MGMVLRLGLSSDHLFYTQDANEMFYYPNVPGTRRCNAVTPGHYVRSGSSPLKDMPVPSTSVCIESLESQLLNTGCVQICQ